MVAHLLLCRNTLELWRTLGKDSIGICVLRRLSEKLKRVGDDSSEPSSSSRRLEDHQPSPESLTVRSVAGLCVCSPTQSPRQRRWVPFANVSGHCQDAVLGRLRVSSSGRPGQPLLPGCKAVTDTGRAGSKSAPGSQGAGAGGKALV